MNKTTTIIVAMLVTPATTAMSHSRAGVWITSAPKTGPHTAENDANENNHAIREPTFLIDVNTVDDEEETDAGEKMDDDDDDDDDV